MAYFSSQPLPGLSDNDLGINSLQAQELQLRENDTVIVTCENIPGIRSVVISPVSQDDYEVLVNVIF